METPGLFHTYGGPILRATAIGHRTYSKDVVDVYFVCDWDTGGTVRQAEIHPSRMCADGDDTAGVATYNAISQRLADYHREHGDWVEVKGTPVWRPRQSVGRADL